MPIRKGEELLDQLSKRLRKSNSVDVAVAWATRCPAVDELRGFCERGGKLRIVVGLDRNVTDPKALWELYDFGELRIGTPRTSAGGIFHPKYYCFQRERGSTVWIGSANLTRGGFGRNDELMLETAASGKAREWFESLWRSLPANPRKAIEAYEHDWRPSAMEQTMVESPVTGKAGLDLIRGRILDATYVKCGEYRTPVMRRPPRPGGRIAMTYKALRSGPKTGHALFATGNWMPNEKKLMSQKDFKRHLQWMVEESRLHVVNPGC